jgi:hypothetical protein
MTTAEMIQIVKDLGVPIAMLGWFAWRVERRLDAIADLLTRNIEAQAKVAAALEHVDDHLDRHGGNTPPMGTPAPVGPKTGGAS